MLEWHEQSEMWWFRLEQESDDLCERAGMKYVLGSLDDVGGDDLHAPLEVFGPLSQSDYTV